MNISLTAKIRLAVPNTLISLLTSIAICCMASTVCAQDQLDPRPDTLSSAELTTNAPDGTAIALPVMRTDVTARIQGMVASVEVIQRFRNTTKARIEARYRMPLPEQAAVFGMQIIFPDRLIEGQVQERDQARVNYEAAKAGGFRTALVEQHREHLFDTKVAGIDPGTEVEIRIQYWQPIAYADGVFSWHFPLTIRPRNRLVSGTDLSSEIDAMDHRDSADGAVEKANLRIELDAGLPIAALRSPSHEITIQGQAVLQIQPKLAAVPMTKDFVLNWRANTGANPALSVLRERVGAFDYVLTTIAPPQQAGQALPRELILVVDSSGSMQGDAWTAATLAANQALDGLRPVDRFNLVDFDDLARSWSVETLPANSANIALARDWLAAATADGGTNIQAGLVMALDMPEAKGFLRQVVFVTDGAVGNEAEIYAELVHKDYQVNRAPASIFTIGVGSAPNRAFLRKTADFGRGVSVIVENAQSLQQQMQNLMAKLNTPQMVGLKANFADDAEVYPRVFPDLYAGEPITIVARMPAQTASKSLQVSGQYGASTWQQSLALPIAKSSSATQPSAGIAKLWARRKIAQLEDDEALSRNTIDNKAQIVATALEHHLLSRYTSFVAIEKRPVAADGKDLLPVDFANPTPDDQNFAATAIGWQLQAWLGALLILIGLATLPMRQRHVI